MSKKLGIPSKIIRISASGFGHKEIKAKEHVGRHGTRMWPYGPIRIGYYLEARKAMKQDLQSLALKIFGNSVAEYIIPSLEEFEEYFKKYHSDQSGVLTERVLAAILKMAAENPEKFETIIQLAKSDWRDALVGAGFENDAKIHLIWIRDNKGN
jgi:hypothetical protein